MNRWLERKLKDPIEATHLYMHTSLIDLKRPRYVDIRADIAVAIRDAKVQIREF